MEARCNYRPWGFFLPRNAPELGVVVREKLGKMISLLLLMK